MDFFDSLSSELGDIFWYTIKKNDNLIPLKQWRSKCIKNFTTLLPSEIKKGDHDKILGTKANKTNGMIFFKT